VVVAEIADTCDVATDNCGVACVGTAVNITVSAAMLEVDCMSAEESDTLVAATSETTSTLC